MAVTAHVIAALITGMVLGLFYFGGLWLTLWRLPWCRRPGRFMAVSSLIRMSAVLPVFYLFLKMHWGMLIAVLLGFLFMREILAGRYPIINRVVWGGVSWKS
jgi:F1F0 ATPase subunit 2